MHILFFKDTLVHSWKRGVIVPTVDEFKESIALSFFTPPAQVEIVVHSYWRTGYSDDANAILNYLDHTSLMSNVFALLMPEPIESDILLVSQYGKGYVGYADSLMADLLKQKGFEYELAFEFRAIKSELERNFIKRDRHKAATEVMNYVDRRLTELNQNNNGRKRTFPPIVKLKRNF